MWLLPELKPHISETVSRPVAGTITCVVTWLGVVAAHGAINNHWWPSDHPQSRCDLGGQRWGAPPWFLLLHDTHPPPPCLLLPLPSSLILFFTLLRAPLWLTLHLAGSLVVEEGCCPADSWLCWDSWCSAKVRNNGIHNSNNNSARQPGLEPEDCNRLTVHCI